MTESPATRISKGRRALGLALIAVTLIAIGWGMASRRSPAPLFAGRSLGGPRYRASGVVRVSLGASRGADSPAVLVAAAARARADFIVLTAADEAELARIASWPRREGEPVIVPGAEIPTGDGPILGVGLRAPGFLFSRDRKEALDDVRFLGGCAFAPHGEVGLPESTDDEIPADLGLEVVNATRALQGASNWNLAVAAMNYPSNPALALKEALGNLEAERSRWDRTLVNRFAAGIAGIDAPPASRVAEEQRGAEPSQEALFGLVQTVVHLSEPLPRNTDSARSALKGALCRGASVIAIPALADPRGFAFVARDRKGRVVGPGATLRFAEGVVLRAGGPVPEGTTLRLLESGREMARGGPALEFEVKSEGVYRVEAFLAGETTPWILSNPISILTPRTELERLHASEIRVESFVLGRKVIDRFETATKFVTSHGAGGAVNDEVLDPKGGRGRGESAHLSFRLSPAGGPNAWCALRETTPRNLSGSEGLSFWVRAEGEYRIKVLLTTREPGRAGTEEWFVSVRTSPAWTVQNVPFDAVRSVTPGRTSSFDPSRVTGLAFVVDDTTMPGGSQGELWIDDLMAY